MSKKRVLAGIMSLLLLITSVFTGNVVTARAEVASSEEYDAFGPDETNPTIVEVELLGYDRGEGPFPISFDGVNENNTIDGWDRMKARVNDTSLTISWSADATVKPLQICVEGAGENNSWLVEDVSENQNSYTINLTQENRVSYLVQVKYQLDDGGSFTYGKDDMLAFNIANPDKGDVLFQIGAGTQYRVGGDETNSEEDIIGALQNTEFAAGNTIKVWAAKYGGKVVGNFDIRIDGTSVFATDDARTAARTDAEGESGYTFTVPEGYASTQLIEFQIEFRDDTSGSGSDPGDVVFNVTGGSGSTLQYSIDNKANWNNIPEAGNLTASELGGVSQIYLKATLSGEDVVSSRSSINVGGEDPITVSAETIGTGDFYFNYDSGKTYEVAIQFSQPSNTTVTSNINYMIGEMKIDGCSIDFGEDGGVHLYGCGNIPAGETHEVELQLGFGCAISAFTVNGVKPYTDLADIYLGNDKYKFSVTNASDGVYEFKFTEAESTVSTIVWTYDENDPSGPQGETFGADALVQYGKIKVVSITRGGEIIYENGEVKNGATEVSVDVEGQRGYVVLKKGDTIQLKLIPDYGYQLGVAKVNERELTPAGETFNYVSTFVLEDVQGQMHLSGAFEPASNTINADSSKVARAQITDGENAAESGTLKLDIQDGTADDSALDKAKGSDTTSSYETVATLDLSLTNEVSKGPEKGNWTNPVTEFTNDIIVGLDLSGITVADGEELVVVRKHGSTYDTLSSASLSGSTLSVPTNKFSTYTIVKKTAKKDLATADVALDQTSYTYDGSAKTPTISVDAAEINASDYTISYANSNGKTGADANKTAGTVTVTITAKDTNANYKGTTTKTFTIAKADPSIGTVSLDSNFGSIYTSTSVATVSAALTRTNTTVPGTLELTDVTSFTTTGTDNYNWKFTPSDTVNYKTTVGVISLTVEPNTLSSLSVSGSLSKTAYAYGDEIDLTGITLTATFANGDTLQVPITDTNLTYTKNLAVGQTSVTLIYTNNGVAKIADVTGFTVSKAKINLAGLAWTGTNFTYNGSAQGPTFTSSLSSGAELNGAYVDASKTDAGDYTAVANIKLADGYSSTNYEFVNTANTAGIVIAEGGATATVSKAWSIARKSITGATITLGASLTYDGTTQTQIVSSVVSGESALTSGTDYTITGNAQKDAGTYALTVTGNGNYTGTATKQFTIGKATLTPTLSGTTTKVYDNKTTVTATNNLTLAVTGLKNSETVTVTAAAYAYDNANVGTNKTITATGITISGEAAKNYELSGTTATVAGGEITQATPTITLSNLSETTQAPTGAKATLNPADASAAVVVEYKVVDTPAVAATPEVPCSVEHAENCASKEEGNTIANCDCEASHNAHDSECGYKEATAGTPATYKWVNTRPTAPGTYEVRAYLPTGTTNVAAIAVENAVTGSYTLTQYTAPAGDNTSNNTGSSSSSGSTTTTPITPETPAATDTTTTKPATKKPATQTGETTAEKTTGVTSEDGSSGWTDIENEISDKLEAALEAAGEDGETETVEVVVEMNGEKKIPTDIFEAIKGQNIVVSFEMGDGIVWTVNGMDVTADKFDNISFGASTGSGVTAIPKELIAGITGENFGMELTLEYEGEFGFTAVMSVNVDKKNAGKYANLFYFNPKTETMEFICSAPVKEDGTTDLTFTHASDYVIVVSDATMSAADNTSLEDVQGAESGDTSDEPATGEVTTDKKAWTPIWIIVIGAFVIIGGIVLFAVKKKND